MIQKIYAKSV